MILSERFNKRLGVFLGASTSTWKRERTLCLTEKRESKCSSTSDESDRWDFLWQICPTSCNFMRFSLTRRKASAPLSTGATRAPFFFLFFLRLLQFCQPDESWKGRSPHTLRSLSGPNKASDWSTDWGKKKTRANKFKLFPPQKTTKKRRRRVWRELRCRKKIGKYRLNKERRKGIGVFLFLCEHKHQRLCLLNLFN